MGFAVLLALAGSTRSALASEGYPDSWRRWGIFGRSFGKHPDLGLGRITGNQRADLFSDIDGCPLRPSRNKNCREKASIEPGTPVAVLPSALPGLACVLDPGTPGQPAGWLPQTRVQVLTPDRAPALTLWIGKWRKGDDTIVLTRGQDGHLRVSGRAYWPGRGIPPQNTGELTDDSRPDGNQVHFGPGDDPAECQVKLTLLGGDLLAASENGRCGGGNVSFGGVYKRSR